MSLDNFDRLREGFTADDHENEVHLSADALGVDAGDSLPCRPEEFNEFSGILVGNDPQDLNTHGQLFLDIEPDKIARGVSSRVNEIIKNVGQVLHDLADRHEPDQDFKKTK